MDPRSVIAKDAARAVLVMSQTLGNDFETLCYKYMSKECFLKMLNAGTKVITEAGHAAILGILRNTCAPK